MSRKRKVGRPKGSRNKLKVPIIKITTRKTMDKEGIYEGPSENSFKSNKEIERECLDKARVQIEEGSLINVKIVVKSIIPSTRKKSCSR